MKIQVNRQLLPLKIHYFFKYGGISFFSLLSVIARQKGIPNIAVGLIWTITPILSTMINLFNSAIADTFKIYRAMFLGAMVVLSSSFITFFLLPDMPKPGQHSPDALTRAQLCLQDPLPTFTLCPTTDWSTWPRDCPSDNTTVEVTELDVDVKTCWLQCFSLQNVSEVAFNHTYYFSLPSSTESNVLSTSPSLFSVCNVRNCTLLSGMDMSGVSSESSWVGGDSCDSLHCTFSCDGPEEDISLAQVVRTSQFWIILLLLLLVYGGNATTTTMADTVCFSLLGKERHKYGRQRLWGSVGWGIVGLTSGALIDAFTSEGSPDNYTPALIMAASFLAINLVVSYCIPFNVPDKEKLKAANVGRALCTLRIMIYLVMVFIGGLNMGSVWTFLFILVEDVAKAWDPTFHNIKLLQGLMLGVSCFLGEVVSYFLSPLLIKKLGNIPTFTLSLIGFTVRVFCYSVIINPWFFLPIELLHGLSFGAFYPNVMSYASLISPKGAQATIQSIVKTLFILGGSAGSLVGGVLMSSVGGSTTYLYIAIFNVFFTTGYVVIQFYLYKTRGPGPGHTKSVEQEQADQAEHKGNKTAGDETERKELTKEEEATGRSPNTPTANSHPKDVSVSLSHNEDDLH